MNNVIALQVKLLPYWYDLECRRQCYVTFGDVTFLNELLICFNGVLAPNDVVVGLLCDTSPLRKCLPKRHRLMWTLWAMLQGGYCNIPVLRVVVSVYKDLIANLLQPSHLQPSIDKSSWRCSMQELIVHPNWLSTSICKWLLPPLVQKGEGILVQLVHGLDFRCTELVHFDICHIHSSVNS